MRRTVVTWLTGRGEMAKADSACRGKAVYYLGSQSLRVDLATKLSESIPHWPCCWPNCFGTINARSEVHERQRSQRDNEKHRDRRWEKGGHGLCEAAPWLALALL
jgi:hypothetical protein